MLSTLKAQRFAAFAKKKPEVIQYLKQQFDEANKVNPKKLTIAIKQANHDK